MSSHSWEDNEIRETSRPVRRKRRKKRVLGLVPKIMLLVFALSFTGIVCAAFGAKLIQPYQMNGVQKQRMAVLKAQLADSNTQNAALERKKAYLERSDGVEAEARDKGYVEPGERSLVIINPPAAIAAPAPRDGFADRMRRAWNNVMGK